MADAAGVKGGSLTNTWNLVALALGHEAEYSVPDDSFRYCGHDQAWGQIIGLAIVFLNRTSASKMYRLTNLAKWAARGRARPFNSLQST